MIEKPEVNKHPKYGTELTKGRRSNGWRRSNARQHRLELGYKNTPQHHIWITGVFFNEDKNRLIWFSNLWHRKFWREVFNRRIRHIKNIADYNFYRKLFYLVLNCDMISVGYHGIMKPRREYKEKNVSPKHYEKRIRPTRLQWVSMHGRT